MTGWLDSVKVRLEGVASIFRHTLFVFGLKRQIRLRALELDITSFSSLLLSFTMDTESQASRPSTTDLLIRRFIYHMWRMDEAAREFGSVKDDEAHEKMRKRWEIGLTYELVSIRGHIASRKKLTLSPGKLPARAVRNDIHRLDEHFNK